MYQIFFCEEATGGRSKLVDELKKQLEILSVPVSERKLESIRLFQAGTPPFLSKSGEPEGGGFWRVISGPGSGDPIWADSPLEILILGVQKGQNFPPAAGFPLVNIDFRAPKPQNFASGGIYPCE